MANNEFVEILCEKIKDAADEISKGNKKAVGHLTSYSLTLFNGTENPNTSLVAPVLAIHRSDIKEIIDEGEEDDLKEIVDLIENLADAIIENDDTSINHDLREFMLIVKKYR